MKADGGQYQAVDLAGTFVLLIGGVRHLVPARTGGFVLPAGTLQIFQ